MSKGTVVAALLQVGAAVRYGRYRVGVERVAGVPILNRHFLQMQTGVEEVSATAQYDWVVAFDSATTDRQMVDFCDGECRVMGHPEKGGVAFATLRSTEGRLHELLEMRSSGVAFVEPDVPVDVIPEIRSVASSDTPWSHAKVNLDGTSYTGKGIHIYVMDTGVRTTHEDFGGRAIPTLDTLTANGVPTECNGDDACSADTHGHGTHCAGSAGGTKYGIAKEATLYAMRVCCGQGTNVHAGMDWVVQKANRPAIMTVSLAAPGVSEASRMVVNAAVAAGVTVFVGAANDNVDTCTMTYGFIPSAISVGATDSNDRRATFSNWGPCNDIYAPGVAILSAHNAGDTATATWSGTSMATPLVAGAGALLLEENPLLTPAGILALMISKSTRGVITDLKEGDPNLLVNVA